MTFLKNWAIALVLSVTLTACGLFQKPKPEVEYVYVKPNAELLRDCPVFVPEDVYVYNLVEADARNQKSLKDCDADKKSLRTFFEAFPTN